MIGPYGIQTIEFRAQLGCDAGPADATGVVSVGIVTFKGSVPKSALHGEVDRAWFHCGKSVTRSKIWQPDTQEDAAKLQTLGQMLSDQIADAGRKKAMTP